MKNQPEHNSPIARNEINVGLPVALSDDYFGTDDERTEHPEYRYMSDLLYDAKKWRKAGNVEYEKRVIGVLHAFIEECMDYN